MRRPIDLYPAIDLIDGKCVRLVEGDFAQQSTYDTDPVVRARAFAAAGAKYLHIVDLDGARKGAPAQTDAIRRLTEASGLKVQSGGGIRTVDDVLRLLDTGVSWAIVGSLAVKHPEVMDAILSRVGADSITLAVDVRLDVAGRPWAATQGWSVSESVDLWAVIERFAGAGLSRLLCTDIGRDGKLVGPNFDLYSEILRRYPQMQVQASGGVSSIEDLRGLRERRVPAVVIGKALYEGRFTLEEALAC